MPGKNLRELAGHPLLAYTIAAAAEAGVFDAIVVSTDAEEAAAVAERYGAEVPGLRPAEMATATSPDIEWIRHTRDLLAAQGRAYDVFSILRPTSPFRRAATIRTAFETLVGHGDGADSLRAVELCRQHPGKMWVIEGDLMRPLLEQPPGVPWHSRQYQDLPPVYVQNSSLEVAWTRVLDDPGDITGRRVLPFVSEGADGVSIDYPEDFERALAMVESGAAELPRIRQVPS